MAQNSEAVCVTSDANGFSVSSPEMNPETLRVQWADVVAAVAYKKDCFAFDNIRVLIAMSSGKVVELCEHFDGFEDFAAGLSRHLPVLEKEWLQRLIVSPAFDRTVLTLIRRSE